MLINGLRDYGQKISENMAFSSIIIIFRVRSFAAGFFGNKGKESVLTYLAPTYSHFLQEKHKHGM